MTIISGVGDFGRCVEALRRMSSPPTGARVLSYGLSRFITHRQFIIKEFYPVALDFYVIHRVMCDDNSDIIAPLATKELRFELFFIHVVYV